MGKGDLLTGFVLIGLLAAMPTVAVEVQTNAPARCACCADSGTWSERTRRLTAEEFAELGRLNFGSIATTFVTPAGLEEVRGIHRPADQYKLIHRGRTRDWRLEFQGPNGSSGILAFTIPDRGTFFATDPRDGKSTGAGGPVLYKELRVSGPVTGAGGFTGGSFTLILQGRGNACYHADDFTAWVIQVRGSGLDYALYGGLGAPRPR